VPFIQEAERTTSLARVAKFALDVRTSARRGRLLPVAAMMSCSSVVYAPGLELDLHTAPGCDNRPLIVFVHGGAWIS